MVTRRKKFFNFCQPALVLVVGFLVLASSANASELPTAETLNSLINTQRVDNNLFPFTLDDTLDELADMRAQDMVAHDYFAHQSPTGADIRTVAAELGYDYLHIGENLSVAYKSASEVVSQWMLSENHRNNLLHPNFAKSAYSVTKFRGNVLVIAVFSEPSDTTTDLVEKTAQTVPYSIPNPALSENMKIRPFFGRGAHFQCPAVSPTDILGSLLYIPHKSRL